MMDKIDALLLHYVYDFHQDINSMFDAHFSERINMPDHFLTRDELTIRIAKLYAKGLIQLNFFEYREENIIACWNDITQLQYFLTPQGGKVWESIFHPDWEKYTSYTEEYISDNQKLVIVKSQNYSNVLKAFNFPSKITKLTNWYAFYWKKISSGYIFYDLVPIEDEDNLINSNYVKWHLNWEEIQL